MKLYRCAGNNKQGAVTTLTKWQFATHVRPCTISLYWYFNFDSMHVDSYCKHVWMYIIMVY